MRMYGARALSRRLMKTFAVAAVLAVGLQGCDGLLEPTAAERLVGEWRWIESSGGIGDVRQTPESTGRAWLLRFSADGRAELTEDGVLVASARVDPEPTLDHSLVVRYHPALFGFDSQSVTFDERGELTLMDPCCDGFRYRFERVSW